MMNAKKNNQKKKTAIYLALFFSMAVLLVGFILHNNYSNTLYQKDIQSARAHLWARYLTLLFETETDIEALQERLPSLVKEMMEKDPQIHQIQVLKGMKFLFHTDNTRINSQIDPENPLDKQIYDDNTQVKFRLKKKKIDEKFLFYTDMKKENMALVEPVLKSKRKASAVVKIYYNYKRTIADGFGWIILAGVVIFLLFALLIFYFQRYFWLVTIPGVLIFLLVSLLIFSHTSDTVKQNLEQEKIQHLQTVSTVICEHDRDKLPDYLRLLKESQVNGFMKDWTSLSLVDSHAVDNQTDELQSIVLPGSAGTIVLQEDAAFAEANKKDFNKRARTVAGVFLVIAYLVLFFILAGYAVKTINAVKKNYYSYLYIFPSMTGMLVLVFFPFVWGMSMGFFHITHESWTFVGLDNFISILRDFHPLTPGNFYFTLLVTIMWTVVNVFLHVSIGLILALILNIPTVRMKKIYRVLLILPWAIPNYITALIWKGMFHKQFGAVNAFLQIVGVEAVSWFNNFWTAFTANVMTNTWLGFPFMMVISLGALQSIPSGLYEAAEVDGAGKFQQFRHITLPLLKPALFPAIILGTIWTFNMFNIIYLVSNGAPNRSTDILITQAYRYAFENFNWGYAAAYSIIIFTILLAYGVFSNRATNATEGVFD